MSFEDWETQVEEPPAGSILNLFAKFNLAVTDLTSEIATLNRNEQARLNALPNHYTFSRMSSPGAAVTDIQDFQGPQPGRQWIVRLLSAIASPAAANAAVVIWYVGQIMPGPAAGMLPATMARWQFSSVPGFEKFTSDVITVKPGERLVAGLTGIPAASNIALNVSVDDVPIASPITVLER